MSLKSWVAVGAVAAIALLGLWFPKATTQIVERTVEKVGGVTNYDAMGIGTSTVSGLLGVGTAGATTSINLGKVCYTLTTSNGSTVYWYVSNTGSLATSTTSCN